MIHLTKHSVGYVTDLAELVTVSPTITEICRLGYFRMWWYFLMVWSAALNGVSLPAGLSINVPGTRQQCRHKIELSTINVDYRIRKVWALTRAINMSYHWKENFVLLLRYLSLAEPGILILTIFNTVNWGNLIKINKCDDFIQWLNLHFV